MFKNISTVEIHQYITSMLPLATEITINVLPSTTLDHMDIIIMILHPLITRGYISAYVLPPKYLLRSRL